MTIRPLVHVEMLIRIRNRSHPRTTRIESPTMATYAAVVERYRDKGLYVGYVPGFPGTHGRVEDLDELQAHLTEVIAMIRDTRHPVHLIRIRLKLAENSLCWASIRNQLRNRVCISTTVQEVGVSQISCGRDIPPSVGATGIARRAGVRPANYWRGKRRRIDRISSPVGLWVPLLQRKRP